MNKKENYLNLVSQRKQCDRCKNKGFVNQSHADYAHWDTNEIGNMSMWANNLNAQVIIVAQDYADIETYKRDEGTIQGKKDIKDGDVKDYATETNYYLRELTKILNLDIGLPTVTSKKELFITNSVLCMKQGAMNAPIPESVYENCGRNFLKPLIEIIAPKIIITLGATATKAVIAAYMGEIAEGKEILRKNFSDIFKAHNPIIANNGTLKLFPVYHPGRLGRINRKKMDPEKRNGWELQKADWAKIQLCL